MIEIVTIKDITDKQQKGFSCGVAALDDYFKQFAKGNHTKNIGKTFVLMVDNVIAGYYTTSMGSVDFFSLPDEFSANFPKYPIPIARIARLAVDTKKQGQGWGAFLLADALNRIRDASSLIAAFGVVVDAKDEKAKAFYMKFGFIPFPNNSLCLFLPTVSIPSQN